jgi:hypothetical protein
LPVANGVQWIECPRCGLRTRTTSTECVHCGGAIDPTVAPADPLPTSPSVFQWRYYGPRDELPGSVYIQKYETWTEVTPSGDRSTRRGTIPPVLMYALEEMPRLEAEVEVGRREQAYVSNHVQTAATTDSWWLKVFLALPGIPVTAAYLFAIMWFLGVGPSTQADTFGLVVLSAVPSFLGAFFTCLLWASEAGSDTWWIGGLFGAIALVPCGFVYTSGVMGFLFVAFVHTVLGTSLFLGLLGFVLGAIAGIPAQAVASRLRREHQRRRLTRLEPWHIAAGIGGFGALLALAAGVLQTLS